MRVYASVFSRNQWADGLYSSPQAALRAAFRDWFVDGVPVDEDPDDLLDEIERMEWLYSSHCDFCEEPAAFEEVERSIVRRALVDVLQGL